MSVRALLRTACRTTWKPIQGIRNIIVVASGKGGVGKFTTAVQPGARAGAGRRGGRLAGCGHLRAQPAADDGAGGRKAHQSGSENHDRARGLRHQSDVDRVSGGRGAAHGLARPHGHAGAGSAVGDHPVGRTGLSGRRHAAGHR